MNRVLIVDDEQSILNIVGDSVVAFGFVSVTCKSAAAALKIFHANPPGIVMTDLNLGGEMDGVSLCSRLRYEDKSTIVMAMSGFFSEYDRVYCLEAGFSDFLVKPVDIEALHSALQCAFERRTRWLEI